MRALVHSGGGVKGSWGVGCIQHLLGDLGIQYDIYTGTSVGAINSSFLAQFPYGQEQEASYQLSNLWLTINTKSIYQRWFPFGKFHALWKSSFYDSRPLQQLIRKNISLNKIRTSGKTIAVGTVSLSSGKYHLFSQDSDYLIDAVIGSASFPGALTPVKFFGQLWTDGGVKQLSPIHAAIDLGATEIDVITTSPEMRVKKYIDNPSVIDIFKRSIDLSTDKILSNDIEKVLMYNKLALAGVSDKKVVKLNILRPDFNLTTDVLDFNPQKIREMMQKGYLDAQNKYATRGN